MKRRRHLAPSEGELSAFAGYRFPPELILLGVRCYLRFGLLSEEPPRRGNVAAWRHVTTGSRMTTADSRHD